MSKFVAIYCIPQDFYILPFLIIVRIHPFKKHFKTIFGVGSSLTTFAPILWSRKTLTWHVLAKSLVECLEVSPTRSMPIYFLCFKEILRLANPNIANHQKFYFWLDLWRQQWHGGRKVTFPSMKFTRLLKNFEFVDRFSFSKYEGQRISPTPTSQSCYRRPQPSAG